MSTAHEGTVPFRGYRTWYQVAGDLSASGGELPLLVLHGGPGAPHDYLEDLAILADAGRPVVFYDQLGCGKSDHPDDPALWVMDTFVDEVGTIRDALGLDRVHLLGHSWGGMLAMEYALGQPPGLASLVLASTCASLPAFAAQTRRLKESLPADVQQTIDEHEAAGTTDDEAYNEATMAYFTRWVCRLDLPWPDHVMRSFNNLSEDVYTSVIWTWVSLLDSGISGPPVFQHWSGHLHVGVVDLDTADPPDQDQDLVHTGYTRRSQTSNGCQRST